MLKAKVTGPHFELFGQSKEDVKVAACLKELDKCLLVLKPAIKKAEECENQ